MVVPIQVIRWYRMQCYGGTDSCATVVPIRRYCHKKQKMTQKALAEKIGKKREYVSALEKGQTDMQLSTFLRIANALGLQFSLVVG